MRGASKNVRRNGLPSPLTPALSHPEVGEGDEAKAKAGAPGAAPQVSRVKSAAVFISAPDCFARIQSVKSLMSRPP